VTQLLFQGDGVVRDGALRLSDPARWRADLAGLEGQRLVVTVEKPGTRRSNHYCDRIVAHAGSEWALSIPQPDGLEVEL
jgi:hypothetical protein